MVAMIRVNYIINDINDQISFLVILTTGKPSGLQQSHSMLLIMLLMYEL